VSLTHAAGDVQPAAGGPDGRLLLDLGEVSCGCTDHALEHLYKALADPPDGAGLDAPHDNPWIVRHVEQVAHALGSRLQRMLERLLRVLDMAAGDELGKAAPAAWTRRGHEWLSAVGDRLAGLPVERYTLEDWLLLAEWVVQAYLPDDVIRTEADYLAVRAALAGKVQAAMAGRERGTWAPAAITALLPVARDDLPPGLTGIEAAVIDFARARAAELITDLRAAARHRIALAVIEHQEAMVLGMPAGTWTALRQRLVEGFAELNRDWRRIAITETGRAANEGLVAAHAPGARLKRVEAYSGACAFCRAIHGLVFEVVSPSAQDKNGATQVWAGKSNVGRSASPRKRVGNTLVERAPEERWWVPAGVVHPNCRGRWLALPQAVPGVPTEFDRWLDELLAGEIG
jgi:hypothetical protein